LQHTTELCSRGLNAEGGEVFSNCQRLCPPNCANTSSDRYARPKVRASVLTFTVPEFMFQGDTSQIILTGIERNPKNHARSAFRLVSFVFVHHSTHSKPCWVGISRNPSRTFADFCRSFRNLMAKIETLWRTHILRMQVSRHSELRKPRTIANGSSTGLYWVSSRLSSSGPTS
jgi:hypothetical protein